MGLSYQDVLDILRAIEGSDCQEVILDLGDTRLIIQKRGASGDPPVLGTQLPRAGMSAPVGAAAPPSTLLQPSAAIRAAVEAPSENVVAVRAPMIGRFYSAPTPGARPFVTLGEIVEPGDTVGIIEVMKLMNQIKAGVRGRVTSILVENADMVEYGQPLVLIEPAEQLSSVEDSLAGVSPSE